MASLGADAGGVAGRGDRADARSRDVREGDRVLDIAAGAGGQTLAAARRVGPDGAVLATDISSNILELAAHEARRDGLPTSGRTRSTGRTLDVEPESFDAAISRARASSTSRTGAAPRGHRAGPAARRPVGRDRLLDARANGFFSLPVWIVRRVAGLPALRLPGQPGPFSLGAPGALEAAFEAAGFADVEVSAGRRAAADALGGRSAPASSASRSARSIRCSPESRRRSGRPRGRRSSEELGRFEGPDGFVGPCELLVAAGTAP